MPLDTTNGKLGTDICQTQIRQESFAYRKAKPTHPLPIFGTFGPAVMQSTQISALSIFLSIILPSVTVYLNQLRKWKFLPSSFLKFVSLRYSTSLIYYSSTSSVLPSRTSAIKIRQALGLSGLLLTTRSGRYAYCNHRNVRRRVGSSFMSTLHSTSNFILLRRHGNTWRDALQTLKFTVQFFSHCYLKSIRNRAARPNTLSFQNQPSLWISIP